MKPILFFFIRNYYWKTHLFVKNIAEKYDQKNKLLLDLGAGETNYKKYFKKFKYLALDIRQNATKSIDIIADIDKKIPLKNNYLDYILCTQVLEHTKNPDKLFKEANRVLKNGGKLFLSTNFLYEIHMEPYDYFRFTKYGLSMLVKSNGFKINTIVAQGGIFQVVFYLTINLPVFLFLKRNSLFYYLYFAIFFIPFSIAGIFVYLLDLLDLKKTTTINYECIFTKVK